MLHDGSCNGWLKSRWPLWGLQHHDAASRCGSIICTNTLMHFVSLSTAVQKSWKNCLKQKISSTVLLTGNDLQERNCLYSTYHIANNSKHIQAAVTNLWDLCDIDEDIISSGQRLLIRCHVVLKYVFQNLNIVINIALNFWLGSTPPSWVSSQCSLSFLVRPEMLICRSLGAPPLFQNPGYASGVKCTCLPTQNGCSKIPFTFLYIYKLWAN